MTKDEIRQLLAGYATNTLTERERQALFEAALEDQELFDALHQEQALKDLLADPGTRAQLRQALEKPRSARPRWWSWTAAASAVAAAVLVIAVIRSHTSETTIVSLKSPNPAAVQPAEEASGELKPIPQPAPARASAAKRAVRARPTASQNDRKDELQSTTEPVQPETRAPLPALTASEQQVQVRGVPSQSREGDARAQSQQSSGQAVTSFRDQAQTQASPSQIGGAVGGVISKADVPPLRYTLLKRAEDGTYRPLSPGAGLKAGDAVRLNVVPNISGYLSLLRQDAAGAWTRVFPEAGPGLAVTANVNYQIPAAPIDVTNADQTLRIAVAPAQIKAKLAPLKSTLKKESAANPPFFVDLTIGPKNVP